eukprot:scaffold431_cov334-Pavlova_lutheri.AAC.114
MTQETTGLGAVQGLSSALTIRPTHGTNEEPGATRVRPGVVPGQRHQRHGGSILACLCRSCDRGISTLRFAAEGNISSRGGVLFTSDGAYGERMRSYAACFFSFASSLFIVADFFILCTISLYRSKSLVSALASRAASFCPHLVALNLFTTSVGSRTRRFVLGVSVPISFVSFVSRLGAWASPRPRTCFLERFDEGGFLAGTWHVDHEVGECQSFEGVALSYHVRCVHEHLRRASSWFHLASVRRHLAKPWFVSLFFGRVFRPSVSNAS